MATVGGFCLTFEKVLPKIQRQPTLAKRVRMACGVLQRSIKIHAVSAGWGLSSWFMPVEHYCWITEPQPLMGKPPKLLLLLHNSRYKDCLWLLNCIRRRRIEKSSPHLHSVNSEITHFLCVALSSVEFTIDWLTTDLLLLPSKLPSLWSICFFSQFEKP